MAVRDRNLFAWQAYVITMSFVSVGLLLGMFFLWRSYGDLSKRFADQKTSLDTAQQEFTTSNGRVERMLSMMGIGEYTQSDMESMAERFRDDEVLAEVESAFAEQMKLFAPNDPANEKNLLKLPQYLLDTIRLRNEQVDEAREREKQLQQDLTQTVQRETKARDDALAAQKKAEADLEAARQSHSSAIAKLNDEKEEAFRKFDSYKQMMDGRLAQLTTKNQQLVAQTQQQAETIATQAEIINQFRNPDFAAPQGEILRVNNSGRTVSVWVNLGSDDGLRIGVPFSVIDESAINISEAEPKARLVIKNIISAHQALAVVEDYDYRKPIVTGDKVYSPAWRPGRTVGFALVGKLDINDDQKDDSEQVLELIRLAGGKVDARMDLRGNRVDGLEGMTPNTSYLVIGTDVAVDGVAGSDQLRNTQLQQYEAYSEFSTEARSKGIQTISLDKLMGYLKTDSSDRTIPLGNRIRGGDFPISPKVSPPVSSGSVSEIFQKRSPK